jgi:hypothetical protein
MQAILNVSTDNIYKLTISADGDNIIISAGNADEVEYIIYADTSTMSINNIFICSTGKLMKYVKPIPLRIVHDLMCIYDFDCSTTRNKKQAPKVIGLLTTFMNSFFYAADFAKSSELKKLLK